MTYINNIAHIHNDIIKLAKEKKASQEMPPLPDLVGTLGEDTRSAAELTAELEQANKYGKAGVHGKAKKSVSSPPPIVPPTPLESKVIPVAPPDPTAKSKSQAASPPSTTSIPTSVSKNAENAYDPHDPRVDDRDYGSKSPPKPAAPPMDYKAELKSFEENPDNQPKGINKAFSVFSKAKGIFGDVMNKYAENRLQSFLQGQDKKFRPSMRTKQRTATENYAQQYKEMTGKPIFNRSQLNKDMKILNSMRGEVGEHVKAWYKLQHLKTGKVPKLDQEMINTIAQELTKQNKAKKRAAKANKEEV